MKPILEGSGRTKDTAQKQVAVSVVEELPKRPYLVFYAGVVRYWTQVVDDLEAKTLLPLISRWVELGSTVCSDTWKSYTGVAANGYVHRMVKHNEGEYSDGKGNHINGLEGFWGYLKRRLSAKGGIRKERLPLYLAEYVWKYNHRNDSIDLQKKLILQQLGRCHV